MANWKDAYTYPDITTHRVHAGHYEVTRDATGELFQVIKTSNPTRPWQIFAIKGGTKTYVDCAHDKSRCQGKISGVNHYVLGATK